MKDILIYYELDKYIWTQKLTHTYLTYISGL